MNTTSTEVEQEPLIAVDQVWERGGRHYRVVHAGDCVNVRDVDSGRFLSFSDRFAFARIHRCLGSPMSEERMLFRLSDLIRRSGVEDEEQLLSTLERMVRTIQVAKGRK